MGQGRTCNVNDNSAENAYIKTRRDDRNYQSSRRGLCIKLIAGVIFTAILIFSGTNSMAHEMEGDRPDYSESAVTLPAASIQLESGYTYTWQPDSKEHSLGEVLIRWGVIDRFELRFAFNSLVWTRDNGGTSLGKDDPALGIKIMPVLADEGMPFYMPSISFLAMGVVPAGFGDPHESSFRPEFKVCFAWQLGERVNLGINGGYIYDSDEGRRFHCGLASIVLGITISERFGCFFEYYGLYPASAGGAAANYFDMGLTFLVLQDIQLDIRAGLRIDGEREYFTGAGFIGRLTDLY